MGAHARFKQSDLTRAVKGVEKAGLRVGRVEIDANGKIVILTNDAPGATLTNPLDRILNR